jgi:hypothetical protein
MRLKPHMPFRFERDGDRQGLCLVAPAEQVRTGRLTRIAGALRMCSNAPTSWAVRRSLVWRGNRSQGLLC